MWFHIGKSTVWQCSDLICFSNRVETEPSHANRFGTTCCLLYQRASLRYQQGCTTCITEKQRDLSILMPLWQSVCRLFFFQRLQDRIKQHVPKSIRSCSSSQKRLLPARRCKSSTQTNIQSLASAFDFIFYKILPALNIMMAADFLFLPKFAHLLIYLLLKSLSSKLPNPPSADKKNLFTA